MENSKKKKVVLVPFSKYIQVFGPPPPLNLLKKTKNKTIALFKIYFKADFIELLDKTSIHIKMFIMAL